MGRKVYVRIYTIGQHKIKDVLDYTKNLKLIEIWAPKKGGKGHAKITTLKEIEGLKEGDIVFIGSGGKGAGDPKKRELIGIVRVIGKPQKGENEEGVWVTVEAEVLERFFDDRGNKIKEWRDKWPEFESILGRQTSFQRIATEREKFKPIMEKIKEVLNAQKFRGDS